jgi:hypothetical protein
MDARRPAPTSTFPGPPYPPCWRGPGQDLIGFLNALRAWVRRHECADQVDAFIA